MKTNGLSSIEIEFIVKFTQMDSSRMKLAPFSL
jgi:hypothetical protein